VKPNIHPEYKVGTITCACGNTFQMRSTIGEMRLEICSACHPFFTGKQKLVDSTGQVEKFRRRYNLTTDTTAKKESEDSTTNNNQ